MQVFRIMRFSLVSSILYLVSEYNMPTRGGGTPPLSDCRKTMSFRASALYWRGNPPSFQTFSMQNMKFFCSFRGLPHQPAGWFAMTSLLWDFFDTLQGAAERRPFYRAFLSPRTRSQRQPRRRRRASGYCRRAVRRPGGSPAGRASRKPCRTPAGLPRWPF